MSQIFHRSANTIARVTIFGAVFFIAGLLGSRRQVNRSPWVTAGARRARTADSVQPRAPRRRQRHRLPLLPYVGRGLVVRGNSADQDLHELPLADLFQQPVPRAGPRELPHRPSIAVDPRPRPAGFRLLQSQHPRSQRRRLHDVPRPGRSHAADVAGDIRCRWNGASTATATPSATSVRASAVFRIDYVPPANQLELGERLVAEYQIQKLTSCSTCHR